MSIRDAQSEIVAELIERLRSVPDFGQQVFEDSVRRVLDTEDNTLPEDFIVIQQGNGEELERVGAGGVRERATLNLVAMTSRRQYGSALRAARLAIKAALRGNRGGLVTANLQLLNFTTEEAYPRQAGGRLAAHNLQVSITYVQPYA